MTGITTPHTHTHTHFQGLAGNLCRMAQPVNAWPPELSQTWPLLEKLQAIFLDNWEQQDWVVLLHLLSYLGGSITQFASKSMFSVEKPTYLDLQQPSLGKPKS